MILQKFKITKDFGKLGKYIIFFQYNYSQHPAWVIENEEICEVHANNPSMLVKKS